MTPQSTLAPDGWREALGAEDQRALREDGVLHLRAVADEAAVAAMHQAWDQLLSEEASRSRGGNDGPSGLELAPGFRACLGHPRVMGAVALLLDGDVRLLGFRGREPRAGSGEQAFHADHHEPAPPDRQLLANAFWILDDMDPSNGATRLVPGSHRSFRIPGRSWSHPDARHPGERTVVAKAGDVLVFSAHLWHAGSRNHSGARRRIAIAQFGRSEAVRAHGQAAKAAGHDAG